MYVVQWVLDRYARSDVYIDAGLFIYLPEVHRKPLVIWNLLRYNVAVSDIHVPVIAHPVQLIVPSVGDGVQRLEPSCHKGVNSICTTCVHRL